jgi:micrococcal nuclease
VKHILYVAVPLLLTALCGCSGAAQERPEHEVSLTVPVAGGSAYCTIARVADGDSFTCEGGTRVRMLLIDAPELAQRPWGDSARVFAEALLPVGSRVRLEFDVRTRDPYRRMLAYVYADTVFVNREIVRHGMGVVVVYPPNIKWVDTMRAAADSARAERRGLWEGSAFDCLPADFRTRRCQ